MKKSFLIISVLLVLALQTHVYAQTSSLAVCQSQIQTQQFDAALVSCEEAIKIDAAMGTLGRGIAHSGKGNLAAAIGDFTAVININPRLVQAFVFRGNALFQKGDYKAASYDYERASTLEPRLAPNLQQQISLAREFAELTPIKKVSNADDYASIELTIKATDLLIGRALTALNKKSQTEIEAYDKEILDKTAQALQKNRYNGLAYKVRGDLYKAQNKNELALVEYSKSIVVAPQEISSYKSRAEMYLALKATGAALADYNKMIELKPNSIDGYFERARFYESLKKDDLALADYSKVIELEPKNTLGYSSRVSFYFTHDKYDQALPDIKQILTLQPNDTNGRLLSCQYFNKKGDYNAAINDCTIAINQKSFILSDSAMLERSDAYLGLKKYDLALVDIESAAKANVISKDTLDYMRGKIYLAQGKKTEAAAAFNAAIKENPKNEEAKKALAGM